MSRVHAHRRVVRFGECDPAGIVYFPRFFDWFHECMEHWFDTGLQHLYADLIRSGVGLPAIHTEADFKAPVRFGEEITVELRIRELRSRSMTLEYRVVGPDGGLRATGRTVVVAAKLDGKGLAGSMELPFRERLAEYLAG